MILPAKTKQPVHKLEDIQAEISRSSQHLNEKTDLFIFSNQGDSLSLNLEWTLLLFFFSLWGGYMSYSSLGRAKESSLQKSPTAQKGLSVPKYPQVLARIPLATWKGRPVDVPKGMAALCKVCRGHNHSPSAPTQA